MDSENALMSAVVVVSRRRTPRVAVNGQLEVEIVSVLVQTLVVDLSLGGFSVDTPCSLEVGASHLFRFTTRDDRLVELDARVIHSRRKAVPDRSDERHVSGCEFIHDPSTPTEELIQVLMDSVTDASPGPDGGSTGSERPNP